MGTDRSTPNAWQPDEEIAAALPAVGWKNLVTDAGALTIAKRHPRTALDLGSLLQGHAADRLAQILKAEGHDEYLIEVGGECSAQFLELGP